MMKDFWKGFELEMKRWKRMQKGLKWKWRKQGRNALFAVRVI